MVWYDATDVAMLRALFDVVLGLALGVGLTMALIRAEDWVAQQWREWGQTSRPPRL